MSQLTNTLREATNLLELAGYSFEIDHAHQIFVNRDLRMSQIEWIGFDMDYTLALYRQEALDELSVRHMVKTLIEQYGYPESIREIALDPNFAIRGLTVDKKRGNILKMDSHRYVGKAYHGLQPVPNEVRKAYQDKPIRIDRDRFVTIDSLFGLPEAFVYAALIEHLELNRHGEPDLNGKEFHYSELYDDVRASIDLAHADGSMKREILSDLPKFIRCDDGLTETLHKFRSAGKRLFLMTNSEWYYTEEVMSFLFDGGDNSYPSWRNYFDVVITSAKKPSFFQHDRPFVRLDEEGNPDRIENRAFERGRIYQEGNVTDFTRMLGIRASKVLYVGDHIYGDIVRSKRDSAWRTALIVQEMEGELKKRSLMSEKLASWAKADRRLAVVKSQLVTLIQLHETLEEVYDGIRPESEEEHRKVVSTLEQLAVEIGRCRQLRRDTIDELIKYDKEFAENFNPYWGLLFKEGSENSIFGGQVEAYACLYTSSVSNFNQYSPMQYFRAPRQVMPHEV